MEHRIPTSRVIFEYTPYGKYAAQGNTPPGLPGYNIWVQYPDDEYVHYLGFVFPEQLDNEIASYQARGNNVFVRLKEAPEDK